MNTTSVKSSKMSGAAPPPDFDPSSLRARQIAGWLIPFGQQREQSHAREGYRHLETWEPTALDDDLRERGPTRPLMYEHALFTPDRPVEGIPIGRTVELQPYNFGLWCVAELNNSPLANATLDATRDGTLGFSIRATDLDPDISDNTAGGLPIVTRRKLRLREVSLTAEPAWAPESMILYVGNDAVQRKAAPLNAAEFFDLCEKLAAARGEDNYERVSAIITRDAERLERGKARWLAEIDDAKKRLALASTWRQQSAQVQQDARSHGRPLSKADMAWQLRLCTQAATLEAEAKPILASFGLLDETR
jgi:hypothetical protein